MKFHLLKRLLKLGEVWSGGEGGAGRWTLSQGEVCTEERLSLVITIRPPVA